MPEETGTIEPSTEATELSTGATEPSTGATEPSTGATEPSTGATEPSTEAAEPSTGATEPSTEATEPSTGATEPSSDATEPSTEATEPATEPTEAPKPENPGGSCGSNLRWELDLATGTLTITGSGPMAAGEYPAWMDHRNEITSLVIGEGVTTISHMAFSGLQSLTTAKLPSSLQAIGEYAFDGCWNLQMPALSNNLVTIDDWAFRNCHSITALSIPTGVSVIGWGAFSDCRQLSQIEFHNGVTELENYAFNGCFALTSVTVPDSVTQIGGCAFSSCINLTNISLGSGISVISNNMLSGCTSLQKIVIPDNVTYVDTFAFSRCSQLWDVTLGAGVASVATSAFNECRSLSSFKVSESNPHLSADGGVLYNKSSAELVLMAPGFSGAYSVLGGTKRIGEYACDGCYGLTSVSIPGSVTEIGKAAFRSCTGLISLKLGYGVCVIGGEAFGSTSLLEVNFPASISRIEYSAFGSCSNLKKITFAGNMPKFDDTAFYGVIADGYHPGGDPSWDKIEEVLGDPNKSHALIAWRPISCGGGHTPETVPGVNADCTREGLSEGSVCSECGKVIREQVVIPAGHSYGAWETVTPATEKANGLARRSCADCGKTEEKLLTYVPPTEPVGNEQSTDGTETAEEAQDTKPTQNSGEGTTLPAQIPSEEAEKTPEAEPEEKPPAGEVQQEGDRGNDHRNPAVMAVTVLSLLLLGGVGTAVAVQRLRAEGKSRKDPGSS